MKNIVRCLNKIIMLLNNDMLTEEFLRKDGRIEEGSDAWNRTIHVLNIQDFPLIDDDATAEEIIEYIISLDIVCYGIIDYICNLRTEELDKIIPLDDPWRNQIIKLKILEEFSILINSVEKITPYNVILRKKVLKPSLIPFFMEV
jgi:hypothetical protein